MLAAEGVQDYLHEMALANNPPSGTFYDPEHDGIAMASQGVHEHWNNVTQKQYTRNLGTGNGIELLYVTGDPAGMRRYTRRTSPSSSTGSWTRPGPAPRTDRRQCVPWHDHRLRSR